MVKNKKVIVLGSGALKIGEAGEFDYSGGQALKALKEEGVYTVLVNPNIATIQTSEEYADQIYFLPVTPHFVAEVIKKEKPDGILLAFGGQTALNCGTQLYNQKIFEKYGVEVLGTPVQSIMLSEDRDVFKEKMEEINVKTALSDAANSLEEALDISKNIPFPVIVRSAYALGGLSSGFANNTDELKQLVNQSLAHAPQVLVEESLKGWKEVEYEVVRDRYDNCIVVCNMENFDPMGVHTGESIVVAPSQTLTNNEYHMLRELSIKIARHIGIVGECNIQYTLDPHSDDYRIIEMNARLSRSSALASKATGYPLAFIAAKLALGYGLHELKNSVTKTTSACFEPALDYIVCKLPRWDLTKFDKVPRTIGSSMKSVGEVMAIGKTFEEVFQKGLRMLDIGLDGFINPHKSIAYEDLDQALSEPTDTRYLAIAQAFDEQYSVEQIYELTKIDRWFLYKLQNIHTIKQALAKGMPDAPLLLEAKQAGFSDQQIATLVYGQHNHDQALAIRALRKKLNITPFIHRIDTLAAEYPSDTNYLYMTYHAQGDDIQCEQDGQSVITLGSGTYRIGSSVEFDWCCVNAVDTINKSGLRSVMINCNPETVSTDYDTCERLYFEELSFERVMDIVEQEQPKGVIISMGGQTPNLLAMKLYNQQVHVLGTSPLSIDRAENRHKFSERLDKLGIKQPKWQELTSIDQIQTFATTIGFPLLIRPSYVLSGAAMRVVHNSEDLVKFLQIATEVSPDHPVLVSQFIPMATELEFDAVADQGQIVDHVISEHIEPAGVHSGDATLVCPPQKVDQTHLDQMKTIAQTIATDFEISGPFNIQFLIKEGDINIIELNLRASRTFPFISKVNKRNLIATATKVLLQQPVALPKTTTLSNYVGVKAAQFSFHRLPHADPILGVEMAATGEVGCMDQTYLGALLKALLSVGCKIPKQKILISGDPQQRELLAPYFKQLVANNYQIDDIESLGLAEATLEEDLRALLQTHTYELVLNLSVTWEAQKAMNYHIRRATIDANVPLITNTQLAQDFIQATMMYPDQTKLAVDSWSVYA